MILISGYRHDLIVIMAVTLVVSSVVYGLMHLLLSRWEPRRRHDADASRGWELPSPARWVGESEAWIVFVLPCLNEGRVIAASLERLIALDHGRIRILVVDDGSDDDTADIVRGYSDPRVHLLQRTLPQARQGKGEALNAAIAHIPGNILPSDVDPFNVIVCVVDADGRLEPNVLEEVLPCFAAETLGAVQIGVRISNRAQNLLARMQDIEFVLYTHVFQRGRRHLGSVGLGGNGQFVRLAALRTLGPAPWTRSLTEDLDLGVRLMLRGWTTEFRSATAVHQQGLTDLRRWLRQRTRWFQGHLQSWPLIPWVLRDLTGTRRADLLYHLTSPFLLLVGSFLLLAFGSWIFGLGVALVTGTLAPSWWWLSAYIIAFGLALAFGVRYWRIERRGDIGAVGAVALLHVFVLYATLWYIAGWRAVARSLTGRQGWAKTERHAEPDPQVTARAA